ncbi:MAG: aspartate kinase [Lactobacillales bacterium]|jgi:aspartate kinase|nr:aspartate kinase [Lactobacillales bacterium]
MKVVKFGGSSLASAVQIRKVIDIIKEDDQRKFVVVSAPGKRDEADTKMTDLFIDYYECYVNGLETKKFQQKIVARFSAIASAFSLPVTIIKDFEERIARLLNNPIEGNQYLYDMFLAQGEDLQARLLAEIFVKEGISASYMSPKDAGLLVSDEPGNARILPESYERIFSLRDQSGVVIIPGFFGYTCSGEICTFSRGGSDITGSIIAAGVHADLYENFTDVDGVFAAHPGIVHNPQFIKEMTYREMRELAYAGFSVFHDEALIPIFRAEIPIVIKNTNNPSHPGTQISNTRELTSQPVIGIASDSGFASINITKFLLNREIGFVRKILSILETHEISFEHMPSGIDDLSIIVRESYLTPKLENLILRDIADIVQPDELQIEHDLSILMLIGEGMKRSVGVTAAGTFALSSKRINLEMITQGSSEVSVIFGIRSSQEARAVRALYHAYFED